MDGEYTSYVQRSRILIVDDQPINIRMIHQTLIHEHEVFMATSGEQALAFCQQSPPDLILLDIVMPGMDGLEICRRLKRNPETKGIPIIFVTGQQDPNAESACWEAGGVDFVTKPINSLTLRHRINAQLVLKAQNDILRGTQIVDSVTHLVSRRYFGDRLEAEWRRCSNSDMSLSLLLVDLDCFSTFVEVYGHEAGNKCLQELAQILKTHLYRPFDLAARYDNSVFACLLPETDAHAALAIALNIERSLKQRKIEHKAADNDTIVTMSVGGATLVPSPNETTSVLIHQADLQLRRARNQGGGQVCMAGVA